MPQLLHLFLATLVLLGSAGATINRHFCGGELKSVALFGRAEKCHQDQAKKHCPFHPAPTEEPGDKEDCCDDETELVQLDDQERTTGEALPAVVALVPDFPPLRFNYLPPHPRPRIKGRYEHYHPPPLIPDAVREFQVYRI